MKLEKRQRIFDELLDQYTIEEIFEFFDIEATEVLEDLFNNGLIDPEILERIVTVVYD